MTNEEKCVELIKAVQEAAKFYDAAATQYAVDAVRKPGDAAAGRTAAEYVARSDASHQLERSVIELIRKHFPL